MVGSWFADACDSIDFGDGRDSDPFVSVGLVWDGRDVDGVPFVGWVWGGSCGFWVVVGGGIGLKPLEGGCVSAKSVVCVVLVGE